MVLGMSTDDADRDLVLVLSYLAKRQLKTAEVMGALGMSRSTYYEQRDKGTLTSVEHLMAAAAAFDLNRVDLLVRFGHLDIAELVDYLESVGALEVEGETDEASADFPSDPPRRRRKRMRARLDVPTF